MSLRLARLLRIVAAEASEKSEKVDMLKSIKERYNIKLPPEENIELVVKVKESLRRLPPQLVKDCGITVMGFKDLGPSKDFYPNHGKYLDGALLLNTQLFEDTKLILDAKYGQAMSKFDQTFYHELGHGWDDANGVKGEQLSLLPEWMKISGWSKEPKKGYKRIHIREKGCPEVVGEYYYSPDAEFTRFYAKRNPWDDWADSFSYYVGGCKTFVPPEKVEYFDRVLVDYYEKSET